MDPAANLPALQRLVEIMARLRSPGGCPWDAQQTPESLKPYLLEETHEVIDAIDGGDVRAICEELGDLLLQIVFQARIFEERGAFDLGDVATAIAEKLVRRHPHVFGTVRVEDLAALHAQWEEIKAREKRERGESHSPFARIPRSLPALRRAEELTDRLATAGSDPAGRAADPVLLLQHYLRLSNGGEAGKPALGELLLALVALARRHGDHPEEALQEAINRLLSRLEPAPPSPA